VPICLARLALGSNPAIGRDVTQSTYPIQAVTGEWGVVIGSNVDGIT
jgi:hypothetical protein